MQIALREWTHDDAEWYVEQSMDPEILRFTTTEPTLTAEAVHTALDRLHVDDDALGFVAVDELTGSRLANLAASRHGRGAHASYWVARSARGRGVASQALRMLCQAAFDAWQIDEIRLWTHAGNVASRRVAEKAGFTYIESADETRVVNGNHWPARWYRLRRLASPLPEPPSAEPAEPAESRD
ncbi:GNAT family N-acetyltransferase [Phytoactinopolyspora alkaliphila]|uniref:GNAT family N-acetyltransferase n=1 Tax=Phytoactinopolyspora alkaliphila TaxID=1783498 RepID=A0A6N9YRN0_9ACTN|nr:GNAT family protein [Phytoactinopolyspora alkaliphila]NED97634.1 GNAT family N-acetyltransferase [Phytoactinopolyspora alkaliphila]